MFLGHSNVHVRPVSSDQEDNVPQPNVKNHENHLVLKLLIVQTQNVNINVKKDSKRLTGKKCSNAIGGVNGQWIH